MTELEAILNRASAIAENGSFKEHMDVQTSLMSYCVRRLPSHEERTVAATILMVLADSWMIKQKPKKEGA